MAIIISVQGGTVEESGTFGSIAFVVTLSEPTVSGLTVDYRTISGTAATNADFELTQGTLTFAPGESSATIFVRKFNDGLAETDESLFLELFNPVGGVLSGAGPVLRATGFVLDDDGVGADLALQVSSPTIVEGPTGSRLVVFEVSLSEPAAAAFSMNYTTVNGTAIAGSDYTATSGIVNFAAGQTTAFVSVPVRGDTVLEATESFGLSVTPVGIIANGAAGAFGVATILNDDAGAAGPTISVQGGTVEESGTFGSIAFVVTLSEPTVSGLTVDYRTISGTAATNADFELTQGTLTFAPGESSATIFVRKFNDGLAETDESLFLELFNPVGGVLSGAGPVLRATGFVLDDDGVGADLALQVSSPTIVEGPTGSRLVVFEVSLSEPAAAAFSMNYTTVNGTAIAGSDYTATSGIVNFAAGQTTAFVSVPVRGDTVLEATESFGLSVTPVGIIANGAAGAFGVATILNDDAGAAGPTISVQGGTVEESGTFGSIAFVVTLSEPTVSGLTVDYRTISGTAATNADFELTQGTLTFAPGESSATIFVRKFNDGLAETDESLFLELFNPVGGVLSGAGPVLRATGFVLDDDGVGADLALQVSSPTIVEGPTGSRLVVFEVSLSEPAAAAFSMNYTTVNGTAIAGSDYTATSGIVNFAAGQTTAFVSVPVRGDTVLEATESFGLSVTPVGIIANGAAGASGVATIRNFDLSGNDSIIGTAARERINGDIGNDTLSGLAGNDTLSGGVGNDLLRAGSGADILIGGLGRDQLIGGTDSTGDVFDFNLVAESAIGAQRDVIQNFTRGADRIDLFTIDARTAVLGNDTFAFSGTTAAANSVWYLVSGGNVIVRGDVNGNTTADFEILVKGVAALGATDFVL